MSSDILSLMDIRWAAEECERQQSGELSVARLCNALHYARDTGNIISVLEIQILGNLVDPEKNRRGFRTVPVYFSDYTQALLPQQIESALESLVNNGEFLLAREWYMEFEEIHPFLDGNGRVGAILYNYKNGTLNNPIRPPDVFKKKN